VTTRNLFRLTPREEQVLLALIRGDTTRRIAEAHGIGRQTVKNYVTTIYEKLGVSCRAQAAERLRLGLIAPPWISRVAAEGNRTALAE
jgi:DNA-binding NarL/FixJ family response regulator